MKPKKIFAIGCALALCGCSVRSPQKQWKNGTGSASVVEQGATYIYGQVDFTYDDKGCAFIAFARGSGENYHGGEGKYEAELIRDDQKRVKFSCDLKDETNGTFAVDGQPFDLARGGLLLISAETNPARVEQFALDGAQFKACMNPSNFVVLLKSDARFSDFVKACEKKK